VGGMSWSFGAWRVVVAAGAALLASGCTFEVAGLTPEDAAVVSDVDLAGRVADLSGAVVDLATAEDLAGADLAGVDLTPPPDLATPPDLTPPPDLATPPDMTPVAVISCSAAATPASVNLSSLGTTDWVHWGRQLTEIRNEKSGGAAIGTLSSAPQVFNDGEVSFSWMGGTPTQNESGTTSGLYYLNGTFTLSVAASDTTLQRLRVYVGGWSSRGRFTATLAGTAGCSDTTQKGENGGWNVTYTILFRAAQPGQTLSVSWVREESFATVGSNVRFEAAALDPAP